MKAGRGWAAWRLPFRALADWVRLVGRAFWRGSVAFYNGDDLTYAASVAYYGLLSLFPFCLLAFSILAGVTSDVERRASIVTFLLQYFPTHFDFLSAQLDALQQMRVRLGIGGAIALTWAALGVFSAISSAVNHAWGVETQRSYLKHKLFSFFMLVAAGAVLAVALLLLSAFQIVHATWSSEVVSRFPTLSVLGSLVVRYATMLLLMVVVGLIYYFVPNTMVRFRDVWPGAILTGLLWQGALEGFSVYLHDMSRFRLIHGSVAAVVVFLVWVYTSAVILLYGVQFTAAYARLLRARADATHVAPVS
ncbi:MAG TPA: YihY/virulence factor BrkB family protein [Vicinamibacterales bacterium]|jgi:membrane protein